MTAKGDGASGQADDGGTQRSLLAQLWCRSPTKPRRRRRKLLKSGLPVTAPAVKRGSPRSGGSEGFQLSSRCYLAFSRISTSRQFLVADSGRVSAMTTRSPMPAVLFSS